MPDKRKKRMRQWILLLMLSGWLPVLYGGDAPAAPDPFAVNDGQIPSKQEYDGPLHVFNYDYPTESPAEDRPWTRVLGGQPLTKDKALDYINALKRAVAPAMRVLVTQPQRWNPKQAGWYGMLWGGDAIELTGWEGREAISGTYTGQILPASTYAASGLTVDIRNYAAIYYNPAAAVTLHRVWQRCDPVSHRCPPTLAGHAEQFDDGALIIKTAGVNASGTEWPVMQGAAKWQIYRPPFDLDGTIKGAPPVVSDIYIGIFDIIVKDSAAAPETGWVFTTLVYDKDAPGNDAWDRMVPLGAIWGNDPKVNSARHPHQPLQETFINPDAPAYAKVTLGYGGRLSGPFDIAVKTGVIVDGKTVDKLPSSSCLSCHGTSSFQPDSFEPLTFFYPAKMPLTEPWTMYTPGSAAWNEWFQNRPGTRAQSRKPDVIALDYSTFMEAALMNYAAARSMREPRLLKAYGADYWKLWRQWQRARRH